MSKLRNTVLALGMAAVGALAYASASKADFAANQSRMPNIGSGIVAVDWKIKTVWYNGCNRHYYCKSRKQVCDSYGKCTWQYWDCYYGSCLRSGY